VLWCYHIFVDLIVGAPYAINPDNNVQSGAIYIYLGSNSGIIQKPSQVLYGHTLISGAKEFGFSISAGKDQDINGYPGFW
jgi:integrin alpha 7/syndecan 4